MPLFTVAENKLSHVSLTNFPKEKALQGLIEGSLDAAFKCRFVATEFATGDQHSGRIDTLALSEENNPVIIEYKKTESSQLITQSLFYLSWILDHHGDFEVAARRALGPEVEVDWSDIRVICISPNYSKYDLHAASVLREKLVKLELWVYRLYANHSLTLEQFQQDVEGPSTRLESGAGKSAVMVAAGKKAAITRATASYAFDQHVEGKPGAIRELVLAINDYVTGLDPLIVMVPKKFYVAYRKSQNIVCMEVQHKKILLVLKLDPKKVPGPKGISRDVSKIGHYGTGDLEIAITTPADLEAAEPFIELAYRNVGG
jgi:predicted transport protein